MASIDDGVWIVYYGDWSAFRVFKSEISALRYAVDNGMSCAFMEYGCDPKDMP